MAGNACTAGGFRDLHLQAVEESQVGHSAKNSTCPTQRLAYCFFQANSDVPDHGVSTVRRLSKVDIAANIRLAIAICGPLQGC